MKKIIILSLFVAILASRVLSQSFSINPRVISTGGFLTNSIIETKTTFTNISTDPFDTVFSWTVLSLSKPNGWGDLSICDPLNCYGTITQNDPAYSFTMGNGKNGIVKLDFSTGTAPFSPGNANTKIMFKSARNSASKDTLTVDVKGWATAVKEVAKSKEFSFYPNPAKDNLVLKYSTKEPIQIDIYNILGLRVKTVIYNNNELNIDITDLQNGVYFLRFKDDGKTISKSFTKAE
ncbi:MAG: T9SS type A sorting domain-containing protein [Bacteroidetes bacterium]|nr:T9SS type A sorting domain-containing protein [Bacteroidota bacterium]